MSGQLSEAKKIGRLSKEKAMSGQGSFRAGRRGMLLGAIFMLLAMASPFASAAQRAFRLQPFSALELELPARYVIREASAPSAMVRGDSEVIDRIVFEQHDDRVRVFIPGSITIKGQLVIEIDTVGLKELVADGAGEVDSHGFTGSEFSLRSVGAGDIRVTGLDVDKLRVDLQGSGTLEMSGRATDERLRFAGSGECHAADLAANKADITLEGAGSVEVMAREKLYVRLTGAGSVRYRGDPKLSTSIDGAGTVTRM
jgi:hypothetical protein